jgi:hypothetical protein
MPDVDPAEQVGSCPVCRKRDPEMGAVCEPCRRWLPVAVASLPPLYARLRAELIPEPEPDGRVTAAGKPRDPVAATLTAGPAQPLAPDVAVSGGGGDAPTPLNLHIADLLAPVVRDGGRPIDVTGDNWLPRRDPSGARTAVPAGDQVGVVPVAQVLDQEVRAFIDAGAPGSRFRPTPTVSEMADWLAKRLDWACEHYPALDVFAATVQRLRGQMMGALRDFDPQAERCDGVECKRCGLRMLFRRQDGTGDVECQNPDCQRVFTAADYRDWTTRTGAFEASQREPAEVAELLRQRTGREADHRRV